LYIRTTVIKTQHVGHDASKLMRPHSLHEERPAFPLDRSSIFTILVHMVAKGKLDAKKYDFWLS
jgi:hypothetical protein